MNGCAIEGNFVDGKPSGFGIFTDKKNEKFEGNVNFIGIIYF